MKNDDGGTHMGDLQVNKLEKLSWEPGTILEALGTVATVELTLS